MATDPAAAAPIVAPARKRRHEPFPVSGWARLAGASGAGIAEISVFHPFDTVGKRLMASQTRVFTRSSTPGEVASRLSQVVFRESHGTRGATKLLSLYSGISYGAWYKVLQRIYKYAGQPIVTDAMQRRYGDWFADAFGEGMAKPVMHATSGAIVGVGECVLLPFDMLKVKQQTNPESLRGRSMLTLFRAEGLKLYRGTVWTAARNAPGSFALFGGNAWAKERLFHLENHNKASLYQNFVASIVGSVACILVGNPMDVVKTRVQNRAFDNPETGLSVVRNIVRSEGLGSFYKGFIPKMLVVGPKLVMSFTLAQTLIRFLDETYGSGARR